MTKPDLEKNLRWDDYGIGHVNLPVPLFGKEIEFELFAGDYEQPTVSGKMFAAVTDVLNLPVHSIEKIKDLLWEECDFSFTVGDYGCRPEEGETAKEAHFREFDLHSKEDALAKAM